MGLNTTAHDGIVYSGITKIPKRGKTSAGLSGEDALDRELSWAQAASVEDELYQEVCVPTLYPRITLIQRLGRL